MDHVTTQSPPTNQSAAQPMDPVLVALNVFQAYFLPFVLLIGLFGNTSTITIFIRKFDKDSATSQYCIALAISDTGVLIFLGLKNYLSQGLAYKTNGQYTYNVVVYSVAACKGLRYIEQICMFLSSWYIAMFSMERCFAVLNPFERARLLTNGRRRTALLVMTLFGFIMQIHIAYFYTVFDQPGGLNCWYSLEMPAHDKMTLLMLSVFSTIGVPGLIILTMNILISARLLSSTKKIAKTSDTNDGKDIQARQAREAKTIVTLMCISAFFFISMMPTFVVWTYLDYLSLVAGDVQGSLSLFPIALFTDSLTIFNYSLNFIIYGSSLDFFRKDLMKLLRCGRTKEPKTNDLSKVTEDSRVTD